MPKHTSWPKQKFKESLLKEACYFTSVLTELKKQDKNTYPREKVQWNCLEGGLCWGSQNCICPFTLQPLQMPAHFKPFQGWTTLAYLNIITLYIQTVCLEWNVHFYAFLFLKGRLKATRYQAKKTSKTKNSKNFPTIVCFLSIPLKTTTYLPHCHSFVFSILTLSTNMNRRCLIKWNPIHLWHTYYQTRH